MMIQHIALNAIAIVGLGLTTLVFTLPNPVTPSSQAEQTQTYITNVHVIDGGKLSAPQTIQIESGFISAIEAGLKPSSNAAVIDGSGLTALPGLIDTHTHSYGPALKDALRFGVTTSLDMFSDISVLPGARASRKSVDKTNKADLFSSGMMATAPGGHGTQYGVAIKPITQASQAKNWVKDRKAEGSDYIKIVYIPGQDSIPTISRDIAKALITAAHEEDLMALAHISTQRAAQDLIEDGIDGLVHIFADKEASPEIIKLAKKNDIFIIPTLSVIASADGRSTKTVDRFSANFQASLSSMQKQTLFASFPGNVPGFSYETALKNVKLFHDAGVVILAGSDAPNPGTAHGISLHLEMQHLVEAGLTSMEALSAATDKPAKIFNLDKRGSVSVGRRADLVIVGGNLLGTIGDTLDISHVIKNGYDVGLAAETKKSGKAINKAALSDFENGLSVGENLVWTHSADKIANGKSEASLQVENDASLLVKGEIKFGFPYPWAGASIGVKPGSGGLDITEYESIEFSVKGTPGTYRVMAFNEAAMGIPPTQEFIVSPNWETVILPLDGFSGFENKAFTGFAFVAGPALGAFEIKLDDVTLK